MLSNPVGWFEIYVQDLPRAAAFYSTVLDQELSELPSPDDGLKMMAFPMSPEAAGSAGALVCCEGIPSGGNSVMVYFSCEDCSNEESRVEAAGGKVHRSKMAIGQYGFVSLVIDTEGNMFGLHSQN